MAKALCEPLCTGMPLSSEFALTRLSTRLYATAMGVQYWGALLSWVALPGLIAGLVPLGCIATAGPTHAVPVSIGSPSSDNDDPSLDLRFANVTPGQLAVLGPGDPGWYGEEAPVAEREPMVPLVPLPDRAPLPGIEALPGQGQTPLPDQSPMPGDGPSAGAARGLDAEALFADPAARSQMLDQLYDALSNSPDAQAAARLQDAIEKIWLRTGSPTIDVLLGRAILLGQEGDYELALEILNAAISLSPDTAEIWHQRAMVHFLREEHTAALSDLRRTLALDPKHYEAISGLGRVLEHLGQKESALAVFRRALQINPYLEPARLAVEELSREVEGQDI